MKELIHKNMVKADALNCLHCHTDPGHVYEDSTSAAPAVDIVPPPQPRLPLHKQSKEPGQSPSLQK